MKLMKFCGVTIQVKVTGVNHDVEILNIWGVKVALYAVVDLNLLDESMDKMLRNFIITLLGIFRVFHQWGDCDVSLRSITGFPTG